MAPEKKSSTVSSAPHTRSKSLAAAARSASTSSSIPDSVPDTLAASPPTVLAAIQQLMERSALDRLALQQQIQQLADQFALEKEARAIDRSNIEDGIDEIRRTLWGELEDQIRPGFADHDLAARVDGRESAAQEDARDSPGHVSAARADAHVSAAREVAREFAAREFAAREAAAQDDAAQDGAAHSVAAPHTFAAAHAAATDAAAHPLVDAAHMVDRSLEPGHSPHDASRPAEAAHFSDAALPIPDATRFPAAISTLVQTAFKEFKRKHALADRSSIFLAKLTSFRESGTLPKNLQVKPPKIVVNDPEGNTLLTSLLESAQAEVNKKFLDSYIAAMEITAKNHSADIEKFVSSFSNSLSTTIASLRNQHFVGSFSVPADSWHSSAKSDFESLCNSFLVETALKKSAHDAAAAVRQSVRDDALAAADQLPIEKSIAELINDKLNAKFAALQKELKDVRSLLANSKAAAASSSASQKPLSKQKSKQHLKPDPRPPLLPTPDVQPLPLPKNGSRPGNTTRKRNTSSVSGRWRSKSPSLRSRNRSVQFAEPLSSSATAKQQHQQPQKSKKQQQQSANQQQQSGNQSFQNIQNRGRSQRRNQKQKQVPNGNVSA